MTPIDVVGGKVVVNQSTVVEYDYYTPLSVAFYFGGLNISNMYKSKEIIAAWKAVGDKLGCSAKVFSRMLNGACYRAYIEPNQKIIDRLGRFYSGNNEKRLIRRIVANAHLFREYDADRITNVSAFALFSLSSQDARRVLGSALWKSICKNSRSRNDRIVKLVAYAAYSTGHNFDISEWKEKFRYFVSKLQEIPSTLLGHISTIKAIFSIYGLRDNSKNIVTELIKGKPLNKYDFEALKNAPSDICDTKNMLKQLGLEFNPKWSYRKIKEEHDRASRLLLARRYGPSPFPYVKEISDIEKDGFIARLVQSPADLHEVGSRERHCVHMYTDLCLRGIYVVFDIIKDGIHSTLGFGPNHHTQHMYAFNKVVSDDRKVFGEEVVELVRKSYEFKAKGSVAMLAPLFVQDIETPF